MDPQKITDALGLVPKRVHHAGQPRRTVTGAALEGQYRESYWTRPFEDSDAGNFPAFIERIADRLSDHRDFFAQIRATGGQVSFFVGLFAGGKNIGATLSARLLGRLADQGIDLELDIYSFQDTPARLA